jgi:hypothetical protein
MNTNQVIRKQAACTSHLGMAKAREPPKKGVALVIWSMPALHGHVCWCGYHNSYSKGYNGTIYVGARAVCRAARAEGGCRRALRMRAGRAHVCLWQAKNREVGAPRRGEKKEGPKEGHVSTKWRIWSVRPALYHQHFMWLPCLCFSCRASLK